MTLKTPPDDAVGPVFREVTSTAVTFGQLHKAEGAVTPQIPTSSLKYERAGFLLCAQDASSCC